MTDTLLPGEAFGPNMGLKSHSGRFLLRLQSDGNLVLSDGQKPIWSPGTQGSGAVKATMQTDGNFVLYRADGSSVFQTGTHGRPGSRLVMQDDGNAVVYERSTPYWESRTWGGAYHDDSSWLESYADNLGFAVSTVTSNAAQGAEWITDAAGQIPLVGGALHGVLVIASGPFTFTDAVIKGERIDRALLNDFKSKLAGVQEIAPYAQTVIAFVPGIGQGVAAAIGAGLALAQGKPIDEALKAGIRGALPGGAAATAAFDLVVAAASGDNLVVAAGNTAIGNLGLPAEAQKGLSSALDVVYHAAKGENIPLSVLNQARSYLPNDPNVRKAFDVGLAVAQGKRLQDVVVKELTNLAPAQLQELQNAAGPILAGSPALQAVKSVIADPMAQTGYQLGMGLMSHSEVGPVAINALRSKLPATQRQGFDLALAALQGAKTKPPAVVTKNPAVLGGYVTMKGLEARGATPALKAQFLTSVARNPQARAGAAYAVQEAQSQRGFFSWLWHVVVG